MNKEQQVIQEKLYKIVEGLYNAVTSFTTK